MKKLLLALVAVIMGGFMVATPIVASAPVFAEEKCVLTNILGNATCDKDGNRVYVSDEDKRKGNYFNCSCDSGDGESVRNIFEEIVDIMTVGIGILAAIGITIVGIQYLTAGGSEEKTRKAKRRLLEIVIGIAAYIVLYALLKWLAL